MSRALILLAHGARNPAWAAPFEAVVERIRAAQPALTVRLAFLELMPPDLTTVLHELAEAGATDIEVMPMFLGGAGHVLRDVPPILEAVQAKRDLRIHMHPALGQWPGMVEAMAAVCLSVLQGPRP